MGRKILGERPVAIEMLVQSTVDRSISFLAKIFYRCTKRLQPTFDGNDQINSRNRTTLSCSRHKRSKFGQPSVGHGRQSFACLLDNFEDLLLLPSIEVFEVMPNICRLAQDQRRSFRTEYETTPDSASQDSEDVSRDIPAEFVPCSNLEIGRGNALTSESLFDVLA